MKRTVGRETNAAERAPDVAGGGSQWRRTASGEERLNRRREPLPTRVDFLPELPTTYAAALATALAALPATELDLDEARRALLERHVRLLLAWNAVINLTAIADPAAIARLHVADSLAAIPILGGIGHDSILDIGSGGGFPGLVLAVVLPAARVTLVESVGKKAAFLVAAIGALDLAARVQVANQRAETLAPGRWNVVTARAVAGLGELVELALPLLAPGGHLLAWKRGDIAAELAAGGRAAAALGGGLPVLHSHPDSFAAAAGISGHGIVVIRKDGPTPPGFPRQPAARARRPW
jgi:16S rRNA (guanine527-N7)-methyltransferase